MDARVQSLFKLLALRIESKPELAPLNLGKIARPSVRLVAGRIREDLLGLGESRMGGLPDVPPGFEWPRWRPEKPREFLRESQSQDDLPLGFIAQLDLAGLPQVDETQPSEGWLYFFYDRYSEPWGFDPNDRGCARVIYSDVPRASLKRACAPSDLSTECIGESCRLACRTELSLPDDLEQLELGSPAYDAYSELRNTFTGSSGAPEQHRFLGHPQCIQNEMELECQLVSGGVYCGDGDSRRSERAISLASGAVDWRLLLQVDTDEEGPGWMWGDVGRIYYWIRRQDLAARRFDGIWQILQCY